MFKKSNKIEQDEQARTVQGKKAVLEALERSMGIVTIACKRARIARPTFYQWRSMDSDFRAAADAIGEIALDFVESKLLDRIGGGDTAAIMFYLRCKGKSRGYVEKQQTEHSGSIGLIETRVILPPDDAPDAETLSQFRR